MVVKLATGNGETPVVKGTVHELHKVMCARHRLAENVNRQWHKSTHRTLLLMAEFHTAIHIKFNLLLRFSAPVKIQAAIITTWPPQQEI